MNTKKIDLNLLVTLEALLTERNVTKAAERLYLSQPAVSTQLNRLRDLFDDPLLLPSRRGMTPTAKALEMLEPLRQALEQLRYTLQSHMDFDPLTAQLTITVACTDYVQAVVLMPLVLALRTKAPGVRVAVRHWNPQQLEQQLSSGEVDLAIATPDPELPYLRSRHLYYESYVLIGRQAHPLLKPDLTIEQAVQLEYVIVSPSGGSFATPIDDALAAMGFQRKVVMSAASFLFVPEIVANSDLVALVPRRLLNRHERLTFIDLPWLAERCNISLVWHERTHSHAGHHWIRDLLAELMANQA